MQVKDIMVEPIGIDKSDTISHSLDIMEKKDTRRLLVTHADELIGVLTMRGLTKELGTRKKGSMPASSLHVATAVSNNYVKVLPDTDITDAITLMAKKNGVVIVSDGEKVLGWITPDELLKSDFVSRYIGELIKKDRRDNPSTLKGMPQYAGELMQKDPILVYPGDRVSHLRHLILDNDIGRFPVVENDKLVGIVTEKDVAKAMRAFRDIVSGNQQDSRIKNLIVEDIMKRGVKTVQTNTPVADVIKMMVDENIGGVPVLNLEDELVGFITRKTIINSMAE